MALALRIGFRLTSPAQKLGVFTRLSTYTTPLEGYQSKINESVFDPDPGQLSVVGHLQGLHRSLQGYSPNAGVGENARQEGNTGTSSPPPKGLYIHGEVGNGKTALMDLFFNCVPTSRKVRVHFHSFMLDILSRLQRESMTRELHSSDPPVEKVAMELLNEAWLLCFDEVQQSDYTHNAIMLGLFSQLLKNGAVIVATSNRPLQELGAASITSDQRINHASELGRLLAKYCDTVHLDSDRDYRLGLWQEPHRFFYPLNQTSSYRMSTAFKKEVSNKPLLLDEYVEVYRRKVPVPLSTTSGISRFDFRDLCRAPLWSADYITICNKFHTIFLDNVPVLYFQHKNEARRLIHFIDAAYESKVKLYCTAANKPKELFQLIPQTSVDDPMLKEMIGTLAFDMEFENTIDQMRLPFVTGENEVFAFRRAVSRLNEMQTQSYALLLHQPQYFNPYISSEEDQLRLEVVRRARLQQRIEEEKEHNDGKTAGSEALSPPSTENLYRGEEATQCNDMACQEQRAKEADNQETLTKRKPKRPTFSELHFWGFGWWEEIKKRR